MLYIVDQDCDGACHLKNYCFVITYVLLEILVLTTKVSIVLVVTDGKRTPLV
jgi:hypothetical protein